MNIDESIRRREDTTLRVDGLTTVGTGVGYSGISDGQDTTAVDICRETSRLFTHMSPVQAPIDEGMWPTARLTLKLKCTTDHDS